MTDQEYFVFVIHSVQWITLIICTTYVGAALAQKLNIKSGSISVVAILSLIIAYMLIIINISNLANYVDLIRASISKNASMISSLDFETSLASITMLFTTGIFMCAFARSLYTVSLLDSGIWWELEDFFERKKLGLKIWINFELISRALVLTLFTIHQICINSLSKHVESDSRLEGIQWLARLRDYFNSAKLTEHLTDFSLYFIGLFQHMPKIRISTELYSFQMPNSIYSLTSVQIQEFQHSILSLAMSTLLVSFFLAAWTISAWYVLGKDSKNKLIIKNIKTQRTAIWTLIGISFWLFHYSSLTVSNDSGKLEAGFFHSLLLLCAFMCSIILFTRCITGQTFTLLKAFFYFFKTIFNNIAESIQSKT